MSKHRSHHERLKEVLSYHKVSKHLSSSFAPAPHRLDWSSQPNPFRHYDGSQTVSLPKVERLASDLSYAELFSFPSKRLVRPPAPLTPQSISQLFQDSLSISAWKQKGKSKWSLRVNPSSGNLHPTEAYLVSGPTLWGVPGIRHYDALNHELELCSTVPNNTWDAFARQFPRDSVLICLTSIPWRESWKYGERGLRYCFLDVGHALACLDISAQALGWRIDMVETESLYGFLHLGREKSEEREEPECLLVVHPETDSRFSPPGRIVLPVFEQCTGTPNVLSKNGKTVHWPELEKAMIASRGVHPVERLGNDDSLMMLPLDLLPLTKTKKAWTLIQQRRSALDYQPGFVMPRDVFFSFLSLVLPRNEMYSPYRVLSGPPRVHLAIFVHNVEGLERGLYWLLRNTEDEEALKRVMPELMWESVEPNFPLFLMAEGNAQRVAKAISCHQDIASNSCFSLGMVAKFDQALQSSPNAYRELFWEAGVIGQSLYLHAEACELRGTGIGCFLDDEMHTILGMPPGDGTFQDVYHFTVGLPVDDARLV